MVSRLPNGPLREAVSRAGEIQRRWTTVEDDLLRECLAQSLTIVAIGKRLNRTKRSITHRLRCLKIPGSPRRSDGWAETDDAALRKMAIDNATAEKIGRVLGKSRSAVAGRARRIGVHLKGHLYQRMSETPTKIHTHSWSPNEVVTPVKRAIRVAQARARVAALEPASRSGGMTMMELRAHHCRWPIGDPRDPNFSFCGELRADEGPYCTEHRARAYQPAKASEKQMARGLRRYV